jgi:alpha-ribazole phosphatase/probable phosphoglycerate mutase
MWSWHHLTIHSKRPHTALPSPEPGVRNVSVRLIYETHSITEDNEQGLATGWLPGTLSAAGREAAQALGRRRRRSGAAAIYVSDLRRAVQTVETAFPNGAVPVIQDQRLRECNYGIWNGMPVTQLQAERARRIRTPFPGGESYTDVVNRTRDFLADLLRDRGGETVIVVAHSANRWAIEHLLSGTPLEVLVDADFAWQPGWEYHVEPNMVIRSGAD